MVRRSTKSSSGRRALLDRAYSASAIKLGRQCPRAWALRYLAKIKEPEVTWEQIESGEVIPVGSQRGTAIGTQVHEWAELYLTTLDRKKLKAIDWDSEPGMVLQELLPLLPEAGSLKRSQIEASLNLVVNDVRFIGFVDVVLGGPWDHKTSSNILKYALLSDSVAKEIGQPHRSLRDDLQACLYVLWYVECHDPGADSGLARWNYSQTREYRRSLRVVESIPVCHARKVAEEAAATAKVLNTYKTVEDAPPNTLACGDYGGCWYRREAHCTVPRRLGRILRQMELEQERKAK